MIETVDTPTATSDRVESHWPFDLLLMLGGSTISRLGSVSATMAFPLLALEVNSSAAFAGMVTAAGILPTLLTYPLAGVLADRFDRRRIMIYSQLARALVITVLAVGVWGGADHRAALVLLPLTAILDGVFATFYTTAEIAAFPRVIPAGMISVAMSKNEAQSQGALALGRPLSGFLCGLNHAFPFALGAVTCAFSLFTLKLIKKSRFQLEEGGGKATASLRDVVAWLHHDSFMRNALLVCTVTNLLFQAVILLLIVLAKGQGLPNAFIGILLAASGVGGILVAFTAPRTLHRIRPHQMTVICAWAWLLLVLALLISDHPAVLLSVWCGVGFVGAHMNVALAAYQATNVPEGLRGRVASLKSFATRAPSALGALTAGLVISTLGAQAATGMVVVAMAALVAAVTTRRNPAPSSNTGSA